MSFFYNLNNKLNAIRELPETTHRQLNESAAKKPAARTNAGIPDYAQDGRGANDLGKGKKPDYKSKMQDKFGGSAGDLTKGLSIRSKKVDEAGMSRAAKGIEKYGKDGMQALAKAGREGKDLDKVRDKYNKYDESVEEGMHSQDAMALNPDFAKVGRKPGVMDKIAKGVKRVADFVAPGDEDLLRDLERKSGGRRPAKEAAAPMSAKQKSFAALAEPKDKVTFADKIAGAKKEVDEMLGDVAAEAMKAALGKKQVTGMGEATREIPGGRRHTSEPGGYGRKDDEDAPRVQTQRGRGRPKNRADSETGEVMKPDFSAFGVGGKVNLPKHKGAVTKHKMSDKEPGEKVNEQVSEDDIDVIERLMDQAFADGNKALGNALQDALERIQGDQDEGQYDDDEQVNEKAVSKKQQRFMGMVSAAKKGAKPASKEVAKVAKTMKKGDAEDFAKTKHKGLPEKAKAKDDDKKPAKEEKVEETTTSGSVATAPAEGGKKSSGGFAFGGGIYDSMNRDLENMISESMSRLDESMNISMNMNSDSHGGPTKSLTITATDDDADKLAMMLKMAGMGGDHNHGQSYTEAAHMVDENKPDYPTEPEYSNDAFQYSGGLNKPKTDVAGDGQSTGQVTAVSTVHKEDDEDNLDEAADSGMADRVRDLVGDFDRNMTQMRVYGDPDVDRAIAYLKQGDAEAAVEAVVDSYGDQDGGEFRNMSDYAKDLLSDFESLIGSGQDDLDRMMEMAGMHGQTSQLDEGVMDKIKGLVPRFMQMVGADTAAEIAKQVKQVTGGDYSLTQDNAVKVAKAFGLDKMQPPGGQGQQQMAEGIAGNWQGKLMQLVYTGLAGAGMLAGLTGAGGPFAGRFAAIIGVLLLLFAHTFWSSDRGMVGAMGRHGNKGFETDKGPESLEEDDLDRMMEMAGVKKKAMDEEKTEEGNLFTGNLAKARAAGKKQADLDGDGKMEKVDESIFDMTRKLWNTYKG